MKVITDSATERALAAFDAFLEQWIPPAMHEHVFGHSGRAAEQVRQLIRGIDDQHALPLHPGPIGYCVLAMEAIYNNRDYRNGIIYTPASPVFENLVQGENSLSGFRARRGDNHVLGEISEYRVSR
ncbi:hypothetical protein A5646_03570 [Mycobacterium sp. 1245499.0]|uniref:hypothetical protein n=1 Tax=Mycobacterium sp. 1245499.0 TaxID=1834074 RepID=UPI0008019A03|nr:hypothetical protein [Mycobacterium sp. 1245499.0]OBK92393.1 hypothetical protein A5646_03570 [Mycobacterium sp. 1245499.0]